jgi:hypothetical protein
MALFFAAFLLIPLMGALGPDHPDRPNSSISRGAPRPVVDPKNVASFVRRIGYNPTSHGGTGPYP